jgi:6-phosphofructokinase 2
MARIATLTLNPTIDGASEADRVEPTHKVRTTAQRFDPGGGGLNVARVLGRLGAAAEALYLAGGVTGPLLFGLLDRLEVRHHALAIAGDTRIALVVRERQSGREYRFVPEGPLISAAECRACLEAVARFDCDWLVLSGSLPRGVPDDFYAQIVETARGRDIQVVLDTSGAALAATLARGGVRLVKPSLSELAALAGGDLTDEAEIVAAAQAVVASGGAHTVAVSLGSQGAVLVEAARVSRQRALPVEAVSAVGAGDSFVAGMTLGLARGWDSEQAFRLGIAAGTAAVLTPGTELCRREDVMHLATKMGVRDFS